MTHGADMMLRALAMTYSEICKMEVERLKGKKFDKDTLIKYYGDMPKMIGKLLRMQKCGELFETYLEPSEEQHSQWFYDKGYKDGYEDGFDKGRISEETASRCCQILEMYLADNPDKTIKCQQDGYPIVWIGYRDTEESEG